MNINEDNKDNEDNKEVYLINSLTINNIISKKFNLTDKMKKKGKYNNILIYLFLQKIYNYEPGIVRLIGFFHDHNYKYLIMHSYSNERPIKLGRCMGDYYINNNDIDNCICSNCDPDGYNLLKPYRICHRL